MPVSSVRDTLHAEHAVIVVWAYKELIKMYTIVSATLSARYYRPLSHEKSYKNFETALMSKERFCCYHLVADAGVGTVMHLLTSSPEKHSSHSLTSQPPSPELAGLMGPQAGTKRSRKKRLTRIGKLSTCGQFNEHYSAEKKMTRQSEAYAAELGTARKKARMGEVAQIFVVADANASQDYGDDRVAVMPKWALEYTSPTSLPPPHRVVALIAFALDPDLTHNQAAGVISYLSQLETIKEPSDERLLWSPGTTPDDWTLIRRMFNSVAMPDNASSTGLDRMFTVAQRAVQLLELISSWTRPKRDMFCNFPKGEDKAIPWLALTAKKFASTSMTRVTRAGLVTALTLLSSAASVKGLGETVLKNLRVQYMKLDVTARQNLLDYLDNVTLKTDLLESALSSADYDQSLIAVSERPALLTKISAVTLLRYHLQLRTSRPPSKSARSVLLSRSSASLDASLAQQEVEQRLKLEVFHAALCVLAANEEGDGMVIRHGKDGRKYAEDGRMASNSVWIRGEPPVPHRLRLASIQLIVNWIEKSGEESI